MPTDNLPYIAPNTPYSDEFKQSLIGYVRHFNQYVHTVDGPGILRNFYYADAIGEINGLEVQMPTGDPSRTILTTYTFDQVTLPTLESVIKHYIDEGVKALENRMMGSKAEYLGGKKGGPAHA